MYFSSQDFYARGRGAALITAGVLAVGIALGACGGGGSGQSVAAAPTTTGAAGGTAASSTGATGLLAYASCMRSHGVTNFPDPSGSDGFNDKQAVVNALRHVSSSEAAAAQSACSHLLPPGGSLSGQPTRPVTAQDQQDYLRAAACMRSHGIGNFPDPTFANGTVNLDIPSSIDTRSRQFDHASQVCRRLIPRGLPYSEPQGPQG